MHHRLHRSLFKKGLRTATPRCPRASIAQHAARSASPAPHGRARCCQSAIGPSALDCPAAASVIETGERRVSRPNHLPTTHPSTRVRLPTQLAQHTLYARLAACGALAALLPARVQCTPASRGLSAACRRAMPAGIACCLIDPTSRSPSRGARNACRTSHRRALRCCRHLMSPLVR